MFSVATCPMASATWGEPFSRSATEMIIVKMTYPGLGLGHHLDEMHLVVSALFRFEWSAEFWNTAVLD